METSDKLKNRAVYRKLNLTNCDICGDIHPKDSMSQIGVCCICDWCKEGRHNPNPFQLKLWTKEELNG